MKAVAAEKGSRLPALANGKGRVSERGTFSKKISEYFKLLLVSENFEAYSYASLTGIVGGLTAVILYRLALLSVPQE